MDELRPCDCGGEAELMTDELDMSCTKGTVMCMTCYKTGDSFDKWQDAIKAWNTRKAVEEG